MNKLFRAVSDNVPWYILAAIAFNESRFSPLAISDKGAKGMMQIMPKTWDEFAYETEDPFVARDSIAVADRYLGWTGRTLANSQKTGWKVILTAYVWGVGNVLHGNQNPPASAHQYVQRVLEDAELLKLWEERHG